MYGLMWNENEVVQAMCQLVLNNSSDCVHCIIHTESNEIYIDSLITCRNKEMVSREYENICNKRESKFVTQNKS